MILSEEGRSILQKHPLVEGLTEEEFNLLLQVMDEKVFSKGEVISHSGDFSDVLYLLVEGSVIFNKPDAYEPSRIVTYLLHAPASFGESTFLNSGAFPYDIQAAEDQTLVYFLHRRQLEKRASGTELLNKLLLNLVKLDLEGSRALPIVLNLHQRVQTEEEQKKQYSLKRLKHEMLFNWLPKDWNWRERKEIEQIFDIKHLAQQEICVRQNDPIEAFYLLMEGQLNVLDWDNKQNHPILAELLNPGDHFGENSILVPLRSPYTIEARQGSTLLILERKRLEQNANLASVQKLIVQLAQYNPDQAAFIKKNYGEIPTPTNPQGDTSIPEGKEGRMEFLKQHWLTKELSPEEMSSFESLLQVHELNPGAKIIQKNFPSRDLFFIVQGEATLHRDENVKEGIKEKISPGDVLGEFGFLTGQPAPYSAFATTKMTLLQIPFHTFKNLISSQQGNYLPLFSFLSRLIQQRIELWKNKEEADLQIKNQQLVRKKSLWLLALIGLILSFLDPYKSLGNIPAFAITLLQVFLPVVLIHFLLKEPLHDWGWNKSFLVKSLLYAVICIGVFGALLELFGQIADLPALRFFSPTMWQNMTFSLSSLGAYLLFVIVQEWVRRGIVTLSIQRGLDRGRIGWASLLSALLFIGLSPVNAPFYALGLFLKDFFLAQFFLRAPHLFGVILIHFVFGIFFAYLGWYTL